MEKIPNSTLPNESEKSLNFHEISEQRKELRKAITDLKSSNGAIFEKFYKEPMEEINAKAREFKIEDYESFGEAKETLKKQKTEYESEILGNRANIDYEEILKTEPEIDPVLKEIKNIDELKRFRMRRQFEILDPTVSFSTKKRNENVIKMANSEIKTSEGKMSEMDPLVLRETELIKYKEELSETGHICMTPSVKNNADAVGERMLTGKPIFLHGPTGTGKTSLARLVAGDFTARDPEMVYCSPQTKESNVWGKTGIRPAKGGTIETVEIYGPLSKAMAEGKAVIFDEFTALPKEQMVFIKGIFNAKIGDKVNIVGNGITEIKPGFQMIFTANLKSEKNPERQELPPEITREFEQNNIEVKYNPKEEAYDIMLSRLLDKDGSLDMSFYDLQTTLPNLCKVMTEIQESYTNETDREVAKKSGAMDASGKFHSLKKFVMTQGSIEAILSSWLIEKQTGNKERSFAEFLDERFKTALTFKEYSKEDRILAAKILASKGFLITLTAKDLDLPEDIFQFNTIKQLRGDEAIEELKEKSGEIRHLTLKEVASLDPFGKKAQILKNKAESLLGEESNNGDLFVKRLKNRKNKLFGKEKNEITPQITSTFEYKDPQGQKQRESITLNIE
ncbi:MAG: AAA family ATPase, partial [Candidatus Zambryskibacteria bacterium]|nr:AAA family ATPase [Candidatus Zambryskibacteria bacterium]